MKILYTRLSPRHNWDLLVTGSNNIATFNRSWNLHLKGISQAEGWLKRHPFAQIGEIQSDWTGGNVAEIDNLKSNHKMDSVWNVSDLVSVV
jgi:hypothetical protein